MSINITVMKKRGVVYVHHREPIEAQPATVSAQKVLPSDRNLVLHLLAT